MTDLTITELLMFAVSFFTGSAAAYAFHDHSQPSGRRQFVSVIGLACAFIGVVFLVIALVRIR